MVEERRRQRERAIMEEGKNLWMQKKQEQLDVELRDQEELRELAHVQLFGKPGHGAPTGNIRKKKFTEYQLQEPSINGVTNDDSAIPNGFGGDYEYGAAKANPFRPPQDMRHLSKSEPDISPVRMHLVFAKLAQPSGKCNKLLVVAKSRLFSGI